MESGRREVGVVVVGDGGEPAGTEDDGAGVWARSFQAAAVAMSVGNE
jgi:hypothetical protein